ncbi:PREDICTED: wall-associated receptor kinase 5-like [Populus euphratica]|uniref:Wall-associated receptor kinase 5-like n=1 Tax=Populus euphratica TaxID=75702 RepID=A0AAJ6V972_POPEU|nr:PREDICTED: wall-associated receptor kinase 5-like [Populus euphratica]
MILQRWGFLPMMLLLVVAAITGATVNPDVRDGCQERCGDVIVPYPFGIGEQRCAMNANFFLNCNSTDDGHHELRFGENMPARNISLLNGTVTVGIDPSSDCYNKSGRQSWLFNQSISLGSGPFTFSDARNMFTAVGCDTIAMVTNEDITFGAACLSLCTINVTMSKNNSCSGSGCCQTSIPKGLKSLDITIQSFRNHTDVFEFNPCGFAFLEDKDSLDLSDWPLSRTPKLNDTSNVVIEWVAQTEKCENAQANKSSYACGINTNCYYSDNGQGYRCACNEGFEGNPYLEKGCQDIDECKYPETYTCYGKCHNTIGDYECKCSLGMHGDGKVGCQGFAITTIIAVVGAIVSLVIICLLLFMILSKRRKDKNFRENGGTVLKHQRVRIFSEAELTKATTNYDDDKKIGEGGFGSVYKGVLADNTVVAVKKSKGVGTLGYLDPEYLMTGNLTEKSDVYSFGVVLVELLTGEKPNSNAKSGNKRNFIQYFNSALENNDLFGILDFQAADEAEMDEIEAVAELAKRCLNSVGVNRPSMKEVSEELAKLKALNQKSWAQQNSDETEHLLGESSQSFRNNASPPTSQSQTVISFEIENYTDSI